VNPPCVVSAGCVTAVETQLIKEDMAPPASDSSHSATMLAKKGSRKRKSELSACWSTVLKKQTSDIKTAQSICTVQL